MNTPIGIMNVKCGIAWVRFSNGLRNSSTRRRFAANTPSTPPMDAAIGTLTRTAESVTIVLSHRVSEPAFRGGSPMKEE